MMAVAALLATGASAQDFSRKGMFDVGVIGQYMTSSEKVTAFGVVGEVSINNAGGGLDLTYHLTDHLALNIDTMVGNSDFKVKALGMSVSDSATFFGSNLNLDYNILKGPFTPFVTGGVGFQVYSGAIHGTTLSETDFTWNVGAGLRYNFNNHWYAKTSYCAIWGALESTGTDGVFHTATFGLGYRF